MSVDLPEQELVASAPIRVRSGGTTKTVNRRAYRIKGKNGTTYLASQDSKGRMYMVDQAGNLYYDSGLPQIGWYIVDPKGKVYNLYETSGGVESKYVGNISDIKKYDVNGILGMDIPTAPIYAFEDDSISVPPKDIPFEEMITSDGQKK
ncbi:unnamed protein product, partial [Ostreobium quekettii]